MKSKFLLFFLLLCLPMTAYGQESHYQLVINARIQKTSLPILEQEGEIFLSLQDVVSYLEPGYFVRYSDRDKTVILRWDGQYSYFAQGRSFGVIKNQLSELSAAPFFEQGVLYLPASVCARLTGHYFLKSKSYLQFFKW